MNQHQKLTQLKNQFESGSALHAYVIEGEYAEMDTLLNQCAKFVLCPKNGCDSCQVCKKIQFDSHFDHIKLPQEEGQKLLVKDIKFLVEESQKQPIEGTGTNRVFTLNATQSTSSQQGELWQNKLLKVLEEPPQNVYIFIGTTNKNSLLQTVLSRCQIISAKPLSTAEISQHLQQMSFQKSACEVAAALAQGSTLNAQKLVADNLLFEIFELSLKMLTQLNNTKQALPYVSQILSDDFRQKISDFLTILTLILRESIVFRTNSALCQLPSYHKQIFEVGQNYSIEAAAACIEKINQAKARISNNASLSVEIDNLIVDMLETKYIYRV